MRGFLLQHQARVQLEVKDRLQLLAFFMLVLDLVGRTLLTVVLLQEAVVGV